jgi:hypothetical protein
MVERIGLAGTALAVRRQNGLKNTQIKSSGEKFGGK